MSENSINENNINNEEYKETSKNQKENLFPKFFNPKKYNILQKKKEELNNSFLFNKNYKSNIIEIKKENNNDNSNLENSFHEKDLVLPRIPSADSNKINSPIKNKKNIKRNFSSSQNKEKANNKYLPPKPNKVNNIKTIKNIDINYNAEFNKLKKENEYMITELERLNIELRTLVEKQIPLININNNLKKKYKNEEKSLDINKENEKKANRKYLHTLITEYNRIYKNLTIGQDRNIINNLEKRLYNIKKNNSDSKKTNKVLKNQIYTNEQNLKKSQKNRQQKLENLTDFEKKYILYKNKLMEINKENERMGKLLIDEEKKIDELKNSYLKLEEILNYYEETEESIKKKSDEKIKNKELEMKLKQLIKKKEILIHARLTMEKTYFNKIDKQKKYINELNHSLNELNKEIKKVS